MAKKDENEPPKAGDMSWIESFMTPTRGQFQRYLRGQQGQFGPMIRTLSRQLRGLTKAGDPTARAYQRLLAGLPTEEAVSGAYRSRLENLSQYIQGLDTARAGRGVTEAVGALGSALGVEGAGDIAATAGTVSGVGDAGGDVISKALMQGAAGRFAGLETERLGQIAEQRQGLTLGLGEARKAARQERQELARMLAEVRGQRRAAAPNPFDIASMLMQYQQNRRAMSGGGGYGGGYSGGATTTAPTTTGGTGEPEPQGQGISVGGTYIPSAYERITNPNAPWYAWYGVNPGAKPPGSTGGAGFANQPGARNQNR